MYAAVHSLPGNDEGMGLEQDITTRGKRLRGWPCEVSVSSPLALVSAERANHEDAYL